MRKMIKLLGIFNDLKRKSKWTDIGMKMGGEKYTPRIVKYRILHLDAISKINKGNNQNIEKESAVNIDDETNYISYKKFIKKYYKKSIYERILIGDTNEKSDKYPIKPRTEQKHVMIIFEDDPEKTIPMERNHDNPFASDELTLTSESEDVPQ